MATFTTRVELHHAADEDDYETLHSAMEQRGFSRFVTSADGVTYHMPPAEYNFSGPKTGSEVLGLAKAAASQTGKTYAVLVTESKGRTWYELTPA